MQLEHYIAQLLYRYPCVIVPGFGAFLTETKTALYEEKTTLFNPPQKQVSFNPQILSNDGLLINHITTQTQLNYTKALQWVEKTVSEWHNTLNNQSITIENVGNIQRTSQGILLFQPIAKVNFLTTSFGMGTVLAPKINREQAPVVSLPTPITAQPPHKGFNLTRYAVAAVLLIAIGISTFKMAVTPATTVIQASPETVEKAAIVDTPTLQVTQPAENTQSYHIVAGVFSKQTNAQKIQEELIHKGFKSTIVNREGKFMVLYQSYPNLAEAQQALAPIKAQQPEAWLLEENLILTP